MKQANFFDIMGDVKHLRKIETALGLKYADLKALNCVEQYTFFREMVDIWGIYFEDADKLKTLIELFDYYYEISEELEEYIEYLESINYFEHEWEYMDKLLIKYDYK